MDSGTYVCPDCGEPLRLMLVDNGVYWHCKGCGGRAAGIQLLARLEGQAWAESAANPAIAGKIADGCLCLSCHKPMIELPADWEAGIPIMDVCRTCRFVWIGHARHTGPAPAPPEMSPAPGTSAAPETPANELSQEDEVIDEWLKEPQKKIRGWQAVPDLFGIPEFTADFFAPGSVLLFAAMIGLTFYLWMENFGEPPLAGAAGYLVSVFVQGGIFQLFWNFWFLFTCGISVEYNLGTISYLLIFLVSAGAGYPALTVCGRAGDVAAGIGAMAGVSGVLAFYVLRSRNWQTKSGHPAVGKWLRFGPWTVLLYWLVIQFAGTGLRFGGYSWTGFLVCATGAGAGVILWWLDRLTGLFETAQPDD